MRPQNRSSTEEEFTIARTGLSNVLTLSEALVHQNFDIYVTVEFAVICCWLPDGRLHNPPARECVLADVLRFPQVLCDDCRSLFADLLVGLFA